MTELIMRTRSTLIPAMIFWSLASSPALGSTPGDRGIPPPEVQIASPFLHVITPEDYGSHPQNWGVTQDEQGRILIANIRGVLVHDGASWEHVIPHDGFRTQGLVTTRSQDVFVHAQNDFGRLVGNGQLGHRFESLVPETYRTAFDTERVQSVLAHDQQVWVNTPSAIWCWCDGALELRFQNDEEAFKTLHLINARVHIHQENIGLMRVGDQSLEPVLDSELMRPSTLIRAVPVNQDNYLLLFADGHGEVYDLSQADAAVADGTGFDTWRSSLRLMHGQRITDALRLSDGRIAVSTFRSGVFLFTPEGALDLHLTRDNGLPADSVYSLHEDGDHGLWIATIHGIARAEVHQPIRILDERHGLRSLVNHVARHDGRLYAATSTGLKHFRQGRFETHQSAIMATWRLESISTHGLLIASDDGLLHLDTDSGVARNLFGGTVVYSLTQLGDNHWLAGHDNGMVSAILRNDEWVVESIPDISSEVRSLAVDEHGKAWVGTLNARAYRISGMTPGQSVASSHIEVARFDQDTGLPDSNYVEVYSLAGRVRLGTRFGIYRLDDDERHLVPDPDFDTPLHDGSLGWFVTGEDDSGRIHAQILAGEQRWSEVLSRDENGIFHVAGNEFGRGRDITAVAYVPEPGHGMWLTSGRALYFFSFQPEHRQSSSKLSAPIPGSVVRPSGERILLEGSRLDRDDSALTFRFGSGHYDFPEARRWRTRLAGFEDQWTEWSQSTFRDFTNLPGGRYEFQVQFRDGMGRESPVSATSFEVARPWYLAAPAMIAWSFMAIVLLFLTAWLARLTLTRRNRQLEAIIRERTAQLREQRDEMRRMAYVDPLTGLGNRRAMYERLDEEAKRSQAESGPLTVLAMDMNDFKKINDTHGHSTGDRVLTRVARVMTDGCRFEDAAFRTGGDEFVMICGDGSADEARHMAERISESVRRFPFRSENGEFHVSVSIGIGSVKRETDWEHVLELADRALYMNKSAEVDTIHVITED